MADFDLAQSATSVDSENSKNLFRLWRPAAIHLMVPMVTSKQTVQVRPSSEHPMPRPLTKTKVSGELYARPPGVEAAIELAISQDSAVLRDRASVNDRDSPRYLPSECLLYLIRTCSQELRDLRDELLFFIFSRCEALAKTGVLETLPNSEEIREEILGRFAELIARDLGAEVTNRLDVYEIRFNLAFRALRIDVVRHMAPRGEHEVPLPGSPAQDDSIGDVEASASVVDGLQVPATQEDFLVLKEVFAALSPEEQETVVLCDFLGFDTESSNPAKPTAATCCNVSGRTIRKRLAKAHTKIRRLKEEQS